MKTSCACECRLDSGQSGQSPPAVVCCSLFPLVVGFVYYPRHYGFAGGWQPRKKPQRKVCPSLWLVCKCMILLVVSDQSRDLREALATLSKYVSRCAGMSHVLRFTSLLCHVLRFSP